MLEMLVIIKPFYLFVKINDFRTLFFDLKLNDAIFEEKDE